MCTASFSERLARREKQKELQHQHRHGHRHQQQQHMNNRNSIGTKMKQITTCVDGYSNEVHEDLVGVLVQRRGVPVHPRGFFENRGKGSQPLNSCFSAEETFAVHIERPQKQPAAYGKWERVFIILEYIRCGTGRRQPAGKLTG